MLKINEHYSGLKESYLFTEIGHRVARFTAEHPERSVIRMGIGDVTLPLCPAVTQAMAGAVAEMGQAATFHGYGPEQGYGFLREKICAYYADMGVTLSPEEVFVSDGAKSDLGNMLDLFAEDNRVLIPDPVYPAYVDTNRMAGRPVLYINATEENRFLPLPDGDTQGDIIYICSPNNPTGAVYDRAGLQKWVDFARERGAVIFFDAAYESFISDPTLPRSIYQIPGAADCAIEFCSLSKTAGFTGTRCGYTVVPAGLVRGGMSLNKMWLRRQTTKFNGVSYVVQRGAEAVFTPEGQTQVRANIDIYRRNAAIITEALTRLGIWHIGGVNSPYIWLKCPGGLSSWDYFDRLLTGAGIVGTPGAGFGNNGEGFFRLTAFSSTDNTRAAMKRLEDMDE